MPSIVPRTEWGARNPKSRYTIPASERLWLHHFASEHHGPSGMRAIQNFHMDTKGWSDFAYNYAVDDDGRIYEGRGNRVAGGHTQGDNTTSQAIVLMGNFENRDLTPAMMESVAWLVRYGHLSGWWTTNRITGTHRQAQAWGYSPSNGTLCAGKFAQQRLAEINEMAIHGSSTPKQQEFDDLYGSEIIESFGEAGYFDPDLGPEKITQHWRDARYWTHVVYQKPEPERRGAVQAIRQQLGLAD